MVKMNAQKNPSKYCSWPKITPQGYYFGRLIVPEQFAKLPETGISETLRR